ncbi:uncharacterized protein BO80DRAFT_272131 [Aspergillus ibericus CBS 121593]|uniref:Uncharacterized protein n=1 Tax=Aspergillus ibericus CBS 121593 TaxID=1448316 RepID=A0A395H859_9EURO|nr:hypothetical protein BO80DRAFT_272131 [Aspergillus ibericus CBS 121593]RAL03816.1 hypothetical protein BO80DRAFT_272131 [Aspergillus ibericus CBS 121593]
MDSFHHLSLYLLLGWPHRSVIILLLLLYSTSSVAFILGCAGLRKFSHLVSGNQMGSRGIWLHSLWVDYFCLLFFISFHFISYHTIPCFAV